MFLLTNVWVFWDYCTVPWNFSHCQSRMRKDYFHRRLYSHISSIIQNNPKTWSHLTFSLKHLGLFWNLIFFPEFYVFLWNWTESWSSYVILIKFLRSKRDINFLSWTKYVQPCFEAQPRRGTLQLSSGSTLPCGSFTVFFNMGWNKINKLPIRRYPWFPCH